MTSELELHLLGQVDNPRSSFWHDVRALTVVDRVPVDRQSTVADIGAGAGLLAGVLRARRPRARYTFYEPLDSLASVVEDVIGVGSRRSAHDQVAGADVVALLDVVEHIEDDRAFLASIVSNMDLHAHLVITVPALPLLWSSWDDQLGHHRRYTRRTLRNVVSGLPLDVVEISYLFPELLPPALLRKFGRWTTGRRGDRQAIEVVPDADFPVLPRALDRALCGIATVTYRVRRLWPVGTSLVLVARRR